MKRFRRLAFEPLRVLLFIMKRSNYRYWIIDFRLKYMQNPEIEKSNSTNEEYVFLFLNIFAKNGKVVTNLLPTHFHVGSGSYTK